MTFREVDHLVAGGLPHSAYDSKKWWFRPDSTHSTQGQAWHGAGYRVADVDTDVQVVRFLASDAPPSSTTARTRRPSKYEPLRIELTKHWPREVSMTFREVEGFVQGGLPSSAHHRAAWWLRRNLATATHPRAWYAAGYRVDGVDVEQQVVRFVPDERGAS